MPDRKPTIAEIRERMQTPSKVLWHMHAPADISVLLTALESTQGELEDALGNRDLQELRDELADCKGRLAGYERSDREVRGKWNAELKEVGRLHREVAARDARIAELEALLSRADAEQRRADYAHGRADEMAQVLGYAHSLNYGPTLRTFCKHVRRNEHVKGLGVWPPDEPKGGSDA